MTLLLDPFWGGNPIFQRRANGAVYPVVKGYYSGTGQIWGRIRRFEGSVYLDWFQLTDTVSNANFQGMPGFQAAPGWLILDIRASDAPGTIVSSNVFGAGDVYVVGGQSLAEILIGTPSYGPQTRGTLDHAAAFYVPDAAEGAVMGNGGAGWGTSLGPPGAAITNALSAASGVATGFIFLASGGVPLSRNGANPATPKKYLLSVEGSMGNYPNEDFLGGSLAGLAACGSGGFTGLLFVGNESDALYTPRATDLWLGLNEWLTVIGGYEPAPVGWPFIMSTLGKFGENVDGTTLVRKVQLSWARNTPGARVGASRYDLPLDNQDGLNVHPTAAGALRLGRRIAMDFLHLYDPVTHPRSAEGPKIASVWRDGATIEAIIDLNGSAGLAAQNASADLTGFRVSDDNFATLLTIVHATLSGAVVTITLASDPGAPVSIDYQATPVSATSTDNLIYTTDLVPGDALGLPLCCMAAPMAELAPPA